MATTMQCDIVSAEAQIYSGSVELLVATGVEGELGVCFGHAALLTRLIPGPILAILTISPNDVEPVPATPSSRLIERIDVLYELNANLTGWNVSSHSLDPDNW